MRILVIEDNRVHTRIVERCLTTGGFEDFTIVSSSEQALDCLRDHEGYDLLIVDWMLPGVSGLDFVRALRDSESFHDIPIIMQTAKDRKEHLDRARAAGVDGYVVKPLQDCASLINQIKRVQVKAMS
jgi:CheY-like chemotaxis protein